MAKYTDEQIKKALKLCIHWKKGNCKKCAIGDKCLTQRKPLLKAALDLINRQEAEIERLKEYEEIRPVGCPNCSGGNFSNSKFCSHCGTQLQGKKKDKDREIAEYKSEIVILKDSNKNLQELYYTEREKVKKAKQKVINIAKALQSAKSEAIKEFLDRFDIEYCKVFSTFEIAFMKEFKKAFLKEMVGESN